MASDEHLKTLQLIWNEIKELNTSLSGRIDQTNNRLGQTNDRLDQTNARITHLEEEVGKKFDRTNEMNLRIYTELMEQAKANRMVQEHFERHRKRIEQLEKHVGLKPS